MRMRLSEQVAQQVLALMQAKGLQPGDRLPAERQLALELQVSRPSLREAIQALIGQGVLKSRRGDGTYVQSTAPVEWMRDDLSPLTHLLVSDPAYRYDVLEARLAIESATAWHAAQRATARDDEKIRRCFDIMVAYQDRADAMMASRADAQFHLAIAEASHNLVLVQVMHSLFALLISTVERDREKMFSGIPLDAGDALTGQHRGLMDAILQRDADGARAQMQAHLEYVRMALQRLHDDEARQARSARLPGMDDFSFLAPPPAALDSQRP